MRRLIVLFALMAAAFAVTATPAVAEHKDTHNPGGDVCPGGGTGDAEGATLVENEGGTVTITVEEGFTLTYVCLKAGSDESCEDATFEVEPGLVGEAEVTYDIPCLKDLSHYTLVTEVTTTTTTDTTDTGGPTTTDTTDTGGPTTTDTTDTGGPTTSDTTTGGPTTGGTTTGGTTGGTGETTGATTGGTTGGTTTGGTTGGGGEGTLPFTGFSVWIPLGMAASLIGAGAWLLRRRPGESA
jgi:hypothetical protein